MNHISELAIPVVQQVPSLLLHDLGEERMDLDKERLECIPNIFSFGNHVFVHSNLMNFFNLADPGAPECLSTPLAPEKPA
jgi:hypothetical protein